MNLSALAPILLLLLLPLGCHSAESQGSAHAPCDITVDLVPNAKSVVAKVDASSCKAETKEFVSMLEKRLSAQFRAGTIGALSLMGPVGPDNLADVKRAWEHSCSTAGGKSANATAANFAEAYRTSRIAIAITEMSRRNGHKLGKLSVDNFYAIKARPGSVERGACDGALLTPVIWFEK